MTKLFIISGTEEARAVEVGRNSVSIGRSPSNDIQIRDKFISRSHLKVVKKGKRYFIKDLESSNGTFVDGIRIAPWKKCEVREGAPVVIGMSVVCLGERCSQDIFSVLNALDFPRAERRRAIAFEQDRPHTMKKNMALLYEVAMVLMQSHEIDEMLEKILKAVFDLLGRIERGAIIVVDPMTGDMREVISRVRPHVVDHPNAFSQEVIERVLHDCRALVVSDSDAEEKGGLRDTLKLSKIRSVMCIPLISRSRVRGVIYVDSMTRAYGFRKEDLFLLSSLSGPVAMAIENATHVSLKVSFTPPPA
ncbi:MAG: FHA domain-containing protein [Desulfobacterales bacterium]|nr:FHA domain-containing protein [Desulfobacterales bacterium]